jgi:hypothetical protein
VKLRPLFFPILGGLDDNLAGLFEHRMTFGDDEKDEKLERRKTLEWLIIADHGRKCVDHGDLHFLFNH